MNGPKQRSGCLTIWLVLLIIGSAYGALSAFTFGPAMSEQAVRTLQGMHQTGSALALHHIPTWYWPVSGVLSLLGLVFAIALFAWKRWAFYGICAMSVLNLALAAAMGTSIVISLIGIVFGLGILSALLFTGSPSAWSQME